jgi:hypothetical protein
MKRIILGLTLGFIFVRLTTMGKSRDFGQWELIDPEIRNWYPSLMQPDNPTVPCCGEADAYWADSYEVDGDRYIAIITDPRPDEPLRGAHTDIGTKIVVPNRKLKYDEGNPTGHGIVFHEPCRLCLLLYRTRRCLKEVRPVHSRARVRAVSEALPLCRIAVVRMSESGRYCWSGSKNLATVNSLLSLPLKASVGHVRKSLLAFARIDVVPHVAECRTHQRG